MSCTINSIGEHSRQGYDSYNQCSTRDSDKESLLKQASTCRRPTFCSLVGLSLNMWLENHSNVYEIRVHAASCSCTTCLVNP